MKKENIIVLLLVFICLVLNTVVTSTLSLSGLVCLSGVQVSRLGLPHQGAKDFTMTVAFTSSSDNTNDSII